MDAVLLVGIISGGSAIVASVGAQAIGAAVSRRSEKERLKRDEKTREEDRAERQSERFNESKRAAFVRYLQLREEYRRICRRLNFERHTPERVNRLNDRARYAGADLVALTEEIGLLDPDVYSLILGHQKDDIRDVAKRGEAALREWFTADESSAAEIRSAMRQSLAIASRASNIHNQPQLAEAPADRKIKSIDS